MIDNFGPNSIRRLSNLIDTENPTDPSTWKVPRLERKINVFFKSDLQELHKEIFKRN